MVSYHITYQSQPRGHDTITAKTSNLSQDKANYIYVKRITRHNRLLLQLLILTIQSVTFQFKAGSLYYKVLLIICKTELKLTYSYPFKKHVTLTPF